MPLKKPFSSESIEKLTELVLKYVEVKSELIKLQIKENVFQIIASIIFAFTLIIFAFLIMILLSVAFATYINGWLDSDHLGFTIVGSFYTIILVLLYIFRKRIIQKEVIRIIAHDHFEEEKNKKEKDGV